MIIVLPFIIFISSMWFMLKSEIIKILLTLKGLGTQIIKIFLILAIHLSFLGW